MRDKPIMNDQQQFAEEWRKTVEAFLSRHPEYRTGAPLHASFDHTVKGVASLPGAEYMSGTDILELTHAIVSRLAVTVKNQAERWAQLEAVGIKPSWRQ